MADKRIQDLPEVTELEGEDLFVVEQEGVAKSVSVSVAIEGILDIADERYEEKLVFGTTYDATTNKAATMADIQAAITDAMTDSY